MRQQKATLSILACLLAMGLLAAGTEFGDQLAVAAQQYAQRQMPKQWEEMSRRIDEVQNDPAVFVPLVPIGAASLQQPIGDCVNLFRVGPGRLSPAQSSQCLKLLSSQGRD